jgi:hypothetical protein
MVTGKAMDEFLALVAPETELEARICGDPEWKAGVAWGTPRPGHPEGRVILHVADVLVSIDRQNLEVGDLRSLRLVALVHDTFKSRVDMSKARAGENHHAVIARRFAERYIDDAAILLIVELHDEAHNSWQQGNRSGKWAEAEARAARLVKRLGAHILLYVHFFRADNATGSKEQDSLEWFEEYLQQRGLAIESSKADFAGRTTNTPEPSTIL